MATTCRGICLDYKPKGILNSLKYKLGCKRCSYCGLFMFTQSIRCPCCKTILRTKPRGKKL